MFFFTFSFFLHAAFPTLLTFFLYINHTVAYKYSTMDCIVRVVSTNAKCCSGIMHRVRISWSSCLFLGICTPSLACHSSIYSSPSYQIFRSLKWSISLHQNFPHHVAMRLVVIHTEFFFIILHWVSSKFVLNSFSAWISLRIVLRLPRCFSLSCLRHWLLCRI